MGQPEINREDVKRALKLVDELLRLACSPVQVRRRVERVLANCDSGSHRYAFWRLILALIVAETTASDAIRGHQAA